MSDVFSILKNSLNGLPESPDNRWDDISSVLPVMVNLIVIIAFGVSFITFAYSFIQFVTSSGDPKKLEKPRSALVWSLAGMLLSGMLFALRRVLLQLLGISPSEFY